MIGKRAVPADVLTGFLVVLCSLLFLLSLKNPTSLDDGLRHFAMAAQLRTLGISHVSGWNIFLYEGYLSDLHVDPWFLSDVLMIPFTYLPLASGLHLFIACTVLLLVLVSLLLMRSFKVRPAAGSVFLLILLLTDQEFTARFLFARPYSIMTCVTLLALWTVLQRKWMWLLLCMTVGVLLSQLFVFPLMVFLAAAFAYAFSGRMKDGVYSVLSGSAGTAAGLILHPNSGAYVTYLVTGFLRIPFLKSIGLSGELNSGIEYLSSLSVLCAWAFVIMYLIGSPRVRSRSLLSSQRSDILLLLLLGIACTGAYLVWMRSIDILWPFLVLLMARLYALDPSFLRTLPDLLLPPRPRLRLWLLVSCSVLCAIQAVSLPFMFAADDHLRSLAPFTAIEAVPPGSRVFNVDWDGFFMDVALRPDLRYATGVDKSFTYLTDPAVSETLDALSDAGATSDAALIRKRVRKLLIAYPSDAIAASRVRYGSLITALKSDSAFPITGSSASVVVFSVPKRYRSLSSAQGIGYTAHRL